MKKLSAFFISLLFLIVLAAVFFAGSVFILSKPVSSASENEEGIRFEIPGGESVKSVASRLKEKNLIRNDRIFYIYARKPLLMKFIYPSSEIPASFVLKSGIYYIKPSMNIAEIFNLLSSGRQEYVTVSIPEGFTASQIGELLEEKEICSKADFREVVHSSEFLVKNRIPCDTAEGFLFPDTYFFIPGSKASDIAQQLVDTFYDRVSSLKDLSGMTPNEIKDMVILASIVEREYRVADEAPLIASVFKNRLRHGIGLYSCATVVYILTEFEGRPHPKRILEADTKIDNPYNTYKWAGLPPGAISNPGMTALNAVINTPKTNYYFFQVKDVEKGTHVFTTTFDEHIKNHNLTVK